MGGNKKFSNGFKAKVVLESVRENKTTAQISSEFEVHSIRVFEQRKIVKQNLANLFSEKKYSLKQENEKQIGNLFKTIGKLQVENEWLKKIRLLDKSKKIEFLEKNNPKIGIRKQCELLELNILSAVIN